MDNHELIRRLKNPEQEATLSNTEEEYRKYVVFTMGESCYALPAADVKEITFDNTVYYVPFVPPYIRGFTNRHGHPYTVFDLEVMFRNEKLDTNALLVLNILQDQSCIMISDVDEIVKIPAGEVHDISCEDDSSHYFLEAIRLKEKEVFVLNYRKLLERLERDLER